MPALNHTHTYERVNGKSKKLWRCLDPACSHTLTWELIRGKMSKCPEDGIEFILDGEKLKRKRPVCDNCAQTKYAKRKRLIDNLLKERLTTNA